MEAGSARLGIAISTSLMTAHMGMLEVKGQVLGVEGQFSGGWFGSKV
jgi:hypothetical protein